jgi:hypothetical protein
MIANLNSAHWHPGVHHYLTGSLTLATGTDHVPARAADSDETRHESSSFHGHGALVSAMQLLATRIQVKSPQHLPRASAARAAAASLSASRHAGGVRIMMWVRVRVTGTVQVGKHPSPTELAVLPVQRARVQV